MHILRDVSWTSLVWGILLPVLIVASARAQEPWDGWHGPPSEGVAGIRFGMDREAVGEAARAQGFHQLEAREGTMRFSGKLYGRRMELLAEFQQDTLGGFGGRLYHLRVTWDDLKGGAGGAVQFFEKIDAGLAARHGTSLLSRDSSPGQLSTGTGRYLRVYRDVELQAVLELTAPRPERYNLTLLMDYPQLHPELAGG
jgi:hypothetical protein